MKLSVYVEEVCIVDGQQNQEPWPAICSQVMGEELGNCWGIIHRELGELQREVKYARKLYAQAADVDLLNRAAPDFFGLVQTLLHDSIALRIGRLLDKYKESISLHRLKKLAGSDAKDLKVPLLAIEEAARKSQVWRNKVVAHLDSNVALKSEPDAITSGQIDAIMENTEECLRIVGARYNFSSGSPYNLTDAKALIAILRLGLEERDKQRRAENLHFDLG